MPIINNYLGNALKMDDFAPSCEENLKIFFSEPSPDSACTSVTFEYSCSSNDMLWRQMKRLVSYVDCKCCCEVTTHVGQHHTLKTEEVKCRRKLKRQAVLSVTKEALLEFQPAEWCFQACPRASRTKNKSRLIRASVIKIISCWIFSSSHSGAWVYCCPGVYAALPNTLSAPMNGYCVLNVHNACAPNVHCKIMFEG